MQVDGKMHVDCWIQQVTTRVGAVTCWIQQSVSPKQVVGFSCLFNSEVDQLISKVIVLLKFVISVVFSGFFSFISSVTYRNAVTIVKSGQKQNKTTSTIYCKLRYIVEWGARMYCKLQYIWHYEQDHF